MAKTTKAEKHERLSGAIKDATESWADEVFKPEDKVTEKAKILSVGIGEMTISGPDKDKLAQLFSVATGETVRIEKDEDLELHPMVAIVLTKVDKHDYETGQVLLSIGDGTAVKMDGKVGGYIKPTRKIMRPATAQEMENIPEDQLKGFMKEARIVFA